jgi:hypothetical protein
MAADVVGFYGPCAINGLVVLEWLPRNSLTATNANSNDTTMKSRTFGRYRSKPEPTGSRWYLNQATHAGSDAIE